ncbi:hypothetical protein HDU82_000305 [Entophlyctis luteolus]|nr:hypothetical protein HDU82_000305 [Entophlyctis luteolus]
MSSKLNHQDIGLNTISNLLQKALERRPDDPFLFMRDLLRKSITFGGNVAILHAYEDIRFHHWTIRPYNQLQLNDKEAPNGELALEIKSFKEFMEFFFRDFTIVRDRIFNYALIWNDNEESVSYDVFLTGTLLLSIFEEFLREVSNQFECKSQNGMIPLNHLKKIFDQLALVDEVVIGMRTDLRKYWSQVLFGDSITSGESLVFVTLEEFYNIINKGFMVLAQQ